MRAAIYVRVSTDEQAQSAEVQERDARRFVDARGWHVVEVYRDVGVSGAEWDARPEIARARVDVEREPRPWDVLVVRDLDRVGRDTARTLLFVEVVLAAGARVIEYSTATEAKGDPMARATIALRGVFAEMERGMISARVRGDHEDRARRGVVTGGVVYGYRNTRVGNDVLREVEPHEAAIVREVFERRAAGEGYRSLAQDLNARGIPSPHAGRRGTGSWSPSTLVEMLRRPLYIGRVEWGATRKGYRLGTKVRTPQRREDVIATDAPHLRIVDDDLWQRVRSHDSATRIAQGRGLRRAPPRYMLTGFVRCGGCGGPVSVQRGRWGSTTIPLYGCHWHRDRGASVCAVSSRRPVAEVDRVVAAWITREVLSADAVSYVVQRVRAEVEAMARAGVDELAVARLASELARVETEGQRLAAAVAAGGDLELLVTELRARQTRARTLREEIVRARAPGVDLGGIDWQRVEREARARVDDLAALFARDPAGAREVMSALLPTPLSFTPTREQGARGARWLLTGEAATGVMLASPEGIAHNNTLDNRVRARLVA